MVAVVVSVYDDWHMSNRYAKNMCLLMFLSKWKSLGKKILYLRAFQIRLLMVRFLNFWELM